MKAKTKRSFDIHAFLVAVDGSRATSTYQTDQTVFVQGEEANSIFYILEGRVKVKIVSEHGREAIVAIMEKGEFVGEGCLTGQPLRLATAVAMTKCILIRLEKAAVQRGLREEQEFSEKFISYLLTRNVRVEADLVDHLFNSSEKRLARTLLLLAHFGKEEAPEPVTMKINQETLAEMIGTTRSRVNFFMNKFRKLGFIEYNGDITVNKSLLSVVLHD
jgi:CRP/FNR family transcriptional regulator, cyclic AMP receptor protein